MKTKTKLNSEKLDILIASRWKDKEKMLNAAKKQEEIKRKYGIPEKRWNSLSELRKLRASH